MPHETAAPPRVVATEAALALIERLVARHGELMFHQSGGCCDGSSPVCYIDAIPGRGGMFSLEGPEGLRFHSRGRLFDDAQRAALETAEHAPTDGAD
jgi:uncharacterized protein (DUF779 family)